MTETKPGILMLSTAERRYRQSQMASRLCQTVCCALNPSRSVDGTTSSPRAEMDWRVRNAHTTAYDAVAPR